MFMHWVEQYVAHLGYPEIFLLMAMESSVLPVPSELVMIPAGYLVAQGQMNPLLALLAGALGSLFGASVNYLMGRYLGRALLLRYGRYLLIDEHRYHDSEQLFLRNARLATFVGRLLPGVRHLISLPAGVFGMALLPFALLTALGAGCWCAILMLVGYHYGEAGIALMHQYTREIGIAALLVIAVLIVRIVTKGRQRSR